MRVNGQHCNKKQAVRNYLRQSYFFGITPKTSREIDGMSARQVYNMAKAQFMNQPERDKKKFVEFMSPTVKLPFFLRLRAKARKRKIARELRSRKVG